MRKVVKNLYGAVFLFYTLSVFAVERDPGFYVSASIGRTLFVSQFVSRQGEPYITEPLKHTTFYGLGVGYKLTHNMRIDINGQRRKFQYTAKKLSDSLSQSIENYSAFINIYYDVDTGTEFSPYFTVGTGYSYNRSNHLTGSKSYKQYDAVGREDANFAYNAGVGLKINSRDLHSVELIIGYRYVNLGKTGVELSKQHLSVHEMGLGIIYNF